VFFLEHKNTKTYLSSPQKGMSSCFDVQGPGGTLHIEKNIASFHPWPSSCCLGLEKKNTSHIAQKSRRNHVFVQPRNYDFEFCACGWGCVHSRNFWAGKVCFCVIMLQKNCLWTPSKYIYLKRDKSVRGGVTSPIPPTHHKNGVD
jgi:hypothetical protein